MDVHFHKKPPKKTKLRMASTTSKTTWLLWCFSSKRGTRACDTYSSSFRDPLPRTWRSKATNGLEANKSTSSHDVQTTFFEQRGRRPLGAFFRKTNGKTEVLEFGDGVLFFPPTHCIVSSLWALETYEYSRDDNVLQECLWLIQANSAWINTWV